MFGGSGLTRTLSGDGAAPEATPEPQESGELGGGGGAMVALTGGVSEEDKASGGNRWPRQETLALLKIRSEMDVVFRDSSLKGPLWEQVSRKMAELGYHRSSKKCKEKFENVYKYHKRTKDGRTSKPDGKSYRFFDQLNALENITPSPSVQLPPPSPRPRLPQALPPITASVSVTPIQAVNVNANADAQVTIVSSTPNIAVSVAQNTPPQNFSNFMNSSFPPPQPQPQQPLFPPPTANVTNPSQTNAVAAPQLNMSTSFLSNSSFSSSSSTSSDEDIEKRHKRKRKLKDFFEKVMVEVVERQEDLQKKFLETLEKRERDRMIREEAWRVQEMARIQREHDLLAQERSMAAARESSLIALLQKMTDQQNSQSPNATQVRIPVILSQPPPPPPPRPQQATPPLALLPITTMTTTTTTTPVLSPEPLRSINNNPRNNNGCDDFMGARTSSRWPKAEVEALINIRTTLDNKYQENGPKGPLWEEVSSAMKRIGYNRSSKRCKEKWENINKYFKKVKESNKKRPEDAKTCPYFHQLDALYKERAITTNPSRPGDAMVPIMARPEQQWPLPQVHHHQPQQHQDEHEGDNNNQNDDGDNNDDDGDDDEEEDDEGMEYEMVTNNNKASNSVATSTP